MRDKNATTRIKTTEIIPSKILAIILGLSVSTGVVYIFTFGNTPVYIGYCVSAAIVAFFMMRYPKDLSQTIGDIDDSVLAFCGLAALSLIPSLACCLAGKLSIDASLTVIKGLVVLFSGVVVYLVAVLMRRQRKAVVSGVALGIIVNIVFSMLAQRAYDSGSVFSLVTLFPQNAFVVPLKWGVPEPAGSDAIYSFRAQGLFLEPSHLMVFLVAWCFACLAFLKHSVAKVVLLIGGVYLSVQASSPNIVLLVLEMILTALLGHRRRPAGLHLVRVRKKLSHATLILVILLIFIGVFVVMSFSDEISNTFAIFLASASDINPLGTADTGTAGRFSAMLSTMSVLLNYPFGSGWNTESVTLMAHFGGSVHASHSFALRLLLELGPLGLFFYCWLIWRHAKGAFRASAKGRIVAIAVVCMAIAQFMNGITLLPYVWLLLGLAKGIELDEKRFDSGDGGSAVGISTRGLPA